MRIGGVERVRLYLIDAFLKHGHEVDLVLSAEGGELLALVPPEAHVEILARPHFRQAVGSLRSYFKRRRPDAVLVSLWPLTVIALLARMGLRHRPRIVTSDHNVLSIACKHSRILSARLKASIRLAYPHADAIVAVSQPIADDLAALSGIPAEHITVIHNPNPAPPRREFPRNETNALWRGRAGRRLLTVGRLKTQKNHALLLEAFARIARQHDLVLAILGDGALEESLRRQSADLGIADRVIMPGFVMDPAPWYASADMFVLSSDYEGFGNVLVEALHFGLRIVSTDSPGGPRTILADGKFGSLVPPGEPALLAKAILDGLERDFDPEAARVRAGDFAITQAAERYLALLDGALHEFTA